MTVSYDKVEVLLVEDNPTDAELCIRALREHNLANELVWVKDGAEALDFLFREGAYAGRNSVANVEGRPARSSAAEGRRPGGAAPDEVRRSYQGSAGGRAHVLEGGPRHRRKLSLGINSFISKPVSFEAFSETVAKLGLYWLVVNRPPNGC